MGDLRGQGFFGMKATVTGPFRRKQSHLSLKSESLGQKMRALGPNTGLTDQFERKSASRGANDEVVVSQGAKCVFRVQLRVMEFGFDVWVDLAEFLKGPQTLKLSL